MPKAVHNPLKMRSKKAQTLKPLSANIKNPFQSTQKQKNTTNRNPCNYIKTMHTETNENPVLTIKNASRNNLHPNELQNHTLRHRPLEANRTSFPQRAPRGELSAAGGGGTGSDVLCVLAGEGGKVSCLVWFGLY